MRFAHCGRMTGNPEVGIGAFVTSGLPTIRELDPIRLPGVQGQVAPIAAERLSLIAYGAL